MDEEITIVGRGEIGRRFGLAADALRIRAQFVTRDAGAGLLEGPVGIPLVLCVRETDLSGVLAQIPPSRGRDVVLVQNGFIDEVADAWPDATRAVLWFTSKETFFADLLPSPVHGPRGETIRALITAAGATAELITDPLVFRRYALEKAIWSCVVGAPLAVWSMDLATARHQRMGEIEALVAEACDVVRVALGIEISSKRVLSVLDDTSATLGWMKGSASAIAWRNGKVSEWGVRCGVPTPANDAIVRATDMV